MQPADFEPQEKDSRKAIVVVVISVLLAVNGLGGVLGAEIAVGVLLPRAGVHVALGVVGCFYGLLSAGLLLRKVRARGSLDGHSHLFL